MMQEASGGGGIRQDEAPPVSPTKTHAHLALNNILHLPSELEPSQPFSLLPHLKGYFTYFPTVLSAYLRHDGHDASDLATVARYRSRLWSRVESLAQQGIIDLAKLEYSMFQFRLTNYGLNLIQRQQNSNSSDSAPIGLYALPKRATAERLRALRLTMRHHMIPSLERGQVAELFTGYLDEIEDKQVILTYESTKKDPDAPLIFLPYRTRFTSLERKKANLATYEAIWKQSLHDYRTAVFVTLTTDPKMHVSAYHANKHFQKALNRFMSFLTKKHERRPEYLNVHEFQKNGLLHSHIVIFGLDYLMDFRRLSQVWQRCGQGRIVHIYGLRNIGDRWAWSRAKPKDAPKGKSVDAYLKKYLKKALFESKELELYWTFQKRFFTYSRSLRPAFPQHKYDGPPLSFIGSAPSDMISIVLARRSRSLWANIRAAEYAASTGPPF